MITAKIKEIVDTKAILITADTSLFILKDTKKVISMADKIK